MEGTGPPAGTNSLAKIEYARRPEQTAWRRNMLNQMLEKVREVQPEIETGRRVAPGGPPRKGSLLDVFV